MRTFVLAVLVGCGLCVSRTWALGVDVGPVHLHGSEFSVGSTTDLKLVADTVVKGTGADKDRVTGIEAHRKGDTDDKFSIKVFYSDMDDSSKDLLSKLQTDRIYKAKIEKLDVGWKLLRIRKEED